MFCPDCGKQIENQTAANCPYCGHPFMENQVFTNKTPTATAKPKSIPRPIYYVLASIVFILFLVAAVKINMGAKEIGEISSVAGTSIEEAYYQGLGPVYSGLSLATFASGLYFALRLVVLGMKSNLK